MSKRNENRPGYKKAKVGWIPEEWECIRLGKYITCYSGGTPSRTRKEYFQGKIPWIKSGELNDKFITKTEECISENALKESSVKYVDQNTLLYALYGATAGIPAFTTIKATINQAILAIIPKESVEKYYLFFWLVFAKERLLSVYTQGGQPNLSGQIVKGYKIPLPPLPEQKKIAEVLSAWDRAIEQVGRLIDAKQRLKKGLMQRLLTGRIRFPEFGKPVQKRGELPDGWREVHYPKIFRRVNLKRFQISKKDYKKLGKYPVVDQGQEKIVAWSNAEPITDPLPVIIFGDHTREIKWIDFPFIPGADGTIILISTDETSTVFAYYLLCNTHIVNLGYSRHFSELKSKKFLVPQIPEQTRIAAVLSTCDREIELLKKKQEKLQEQKKGLMQKLLTGEVRVKV